MSRPLSDESKFGIVIVVATITIPLWILLFLVRFSWELASKMLSDLLS